MSFIEATNNSFKRTFQENINKFDVEYKPIQSIAIREIREDASNISKASNIVYGFAIALAVVSVSAAFFAFLYLAPISFFLSFVTLMVAIDITLATQQASSISKKMFKSPMAYIHLSTEQLFRYIRATAFNNTMFVKVLFPVNKTDLRLLTDQAQFQR